MKDKNVLVTGAGGFIASHLVERLVAEGFGAPEEPAEPGEMAQATLELEAPASVTMVDDPADVVALAAALRVLGIAGPDHPRGVNVGTCVARYCGVQPGQSPAANRALMSAENLALFW